jgi:hypothetical protein
MENSEIKRKTFSGIIGYTKSVKITTNVIYIDKIRVTM